MPGFKANIRVALLIILVIGICLVALYGILKPISNGCIMIYMYSTYIPISSFESIAPVKYGLYLYHEGWKKIDFKEHIKKISSVPMLFIPGNGGSYKQAGLDWFAMDDGILEEHAEYVVYAIHKILDQYKESYDARTRVIHPRLRKSAVEIILSLSTPHQSPPLALQPSLGYYFQRVNQEWREGYKVQTSNRGRYVSDPLLSHVVVVSISGAYNDYQVRSKLTSLDNIVPPTHGFMVSSTSMRNVWLSMEHQAILWCNQLVIQVSHTLLSLIDSKTGHPFPDTQKRLAIFSRMLRNGISHNFKRMMQLPSKDSISTPVYSTKDSTGSQALGSATCPPSIQWSDDSLERDLYIQTNVVTVLALDDPNIDSEQAPHLLYSHDAEIEKKCEGSKLSKLLVQPVAVGLSIGLFPVPRDPETFVCMLQSQVLTDLLVTLCSQSKGDDRPKVKSYRSQQHTLCFVPGERKFPLGFRA
ncbi:hypothetical protein K1719_023925 [Acacia pycnantha]|nr:hypothetical protein K1719_023925 [Acacia pycnantha]